ncbi:AMP-binding protein [Virgibacillus flavescens]|uniref:AMP-binding protein n=1 Tax=Virgibacillus flavescens TaxID=1611422 RepID=UPI003D343F9B
MKVFKLIYILYKIKLLSPAGLYRLMEAVFTCGINLMVLLHFAGKKYPTEVAVVDDHETLTYEQLLAQSNKLARCLRENKRLKPGKHVGFLCKNHASFIKAIFAVSRLGADVYLLNPEMSKIQFNELVDRYQFDLVIYDAELSTFVEQSSYTNDTILSYHESLPAINNFLLSPAKDTQPLPRSSASKIILQTSGTTGFSKKAAHKPSLFNYLDPFIAFVMRLKLLNHRTAYIATPIYHGYGLAVFLLFIPLGKKAVISSGFHAKRACGLIRDHQAEVVTVVPLMLQEMLRTNAQDLKSLVCIASGGAKLSAKLTEKTYKELGNVLYNLYGTSEAGLNFIATPQDLLYSTSTVGRKINGMQLKVLDRDMNEVETGEAGQFCIKNSWSMRDRNSAWMETGDLGYQDNNGYYFLCGRTDEMIISGGENVYPAEVENVLMKHSFIEDVAIIGINDEKFGQRLKAFVVPVENASLTENEIMEWLRSRVARYQLPREIELVDDLPYTALGKLDKKQLK